MQGDEESSIPPSSELISEEGGHVTCLEIICLRYRANAPGDFDIEEYS